MLTFVCGKTGSRPGDRFYKCIKKDSGECRFYEWQEGYEKYLTGKQEPDVAADQIPAAQPPPPPPALGADVAAVTSLVRDLIRLNIMLRVTNLMATVLESTMHRLH